MVAWLPCTSDFLVCCLYLNVEKLFGLTYVIHPYPQRIVATYGYSQTCHVRKILCLSSEWVWYIHAAYAKSGWPAAVTLDEHLNSISRFLDWRTTAPHLGLTDTEIEDIEDEDRKNEVRRLKALQRWKRKYCFKATYRKLMEVFLHIGRADLAEEVCSILRSCRYAGCYKNGLGTRPSLLGYVCF